MAAARVGHVLGARRLRSAERAEQRNLAQLRVLAQVRVLSKQVAWNDVVGPADDLLGVVAGVEPGGRVARRAHEIDASDPGLRQVDRVGDDRHVGDAVAMAGEVFVNRGRVALRHAVHAQPRALEVGRVHVQDVSGPRAGRESGPGVRRVRGRVGAAVHPDGPRLLARLRVHLDRDELLGGRIPLFPEAETLRCEIEVRDHVAGALLLADRHPRGIPGQRVHPAGLVERDAAIVADHPAPGGQPRVLVEHGAPVAGQVEAGAGGRAGVLTGERDAERQQTSQKRGAAGTCCHERAQCTATLNWPSTRYALIVFGESDAP